MGRVSMPMRAIAPSLKQMFKGSVLQMPSLIRICLLQLDSVTVEYSSPDGRANAKTAMIFVGQKFKFFPRLTNMVGISSV